MPQIAGLYQFAKMKKKCPDPRMADVCFPRFVPNTHSHPWMMHYGYVHTTEILLVCGLLVTLTTPNNSFSHSILK